MENSDLLLTEGEWADFVNRSKSWARALRYQGRSPAYVKVGGAAMYRREDIAAWMNEHRVRPGGKAVA